VIARQPYHIEDSVPVFALYLYYSKEPLKGLRKIRTPFLRQVSEPFLKTITTYLGG